MSVTQVLMKIKQCNLAHLFTEGIALTCYMHVTMQCSVVARQEYFQKFVIAAGTLKPVWRETQYLRVLLFKSHFKG